MNIEIIDIPFEKDIYGYSGKAADYDYVSEGFRLMDKMWKTVRENGIKNKGINIWVYEPKFVIFTGVELEDASGQKFLEHKKIKLPKYAYYRHTGPFNTVRQAYTVFNETLMAKRIPIRLPYIEIYGHHTPDESKSETELLMCVQG